ncbi:MAG TPA: type II toxin-antitoxin system death-on-curing family toxin, partial [Rudaea sp.]|nr:type II toxin-antitoxin system death-on-curing family toxin [Rudaea sp.]
YGLARNHPFVDGNKRTAAVACETLVELNGAEMRADDLELYPVYIALAEGSLSEAQFAAWLRQRIVPKCARGVHEPRARYAARR